MMNVAVPKRAEGATFAEALAAGRVIRMAQAESILHAIGEGEKTIAEIAAAVRALPCWCGLGEHTLRRTISRMLDAMREEGRILDRYPPSPKGGKVRLVRRA